MIEEVKLLCQNSEKNSLNCNHDINFSDAYWRDTDKHIFFKIIHPSLVVFETDLE